MRSFKRLVLRYLHLAMTAAAILTVAGAVWVLVRGGGVINAVTLLAIAALLFGVSLLAARSYGLYRQLLQLSKQLGTQSGDVPGGVGPTTDSYTHDMLRVASPDDAAALLHTLAELRQDEDLRHSEAQVLGQELRAAQTRIADRIDRIEARLNAGPPADEYSGARPTA